LKASSSCLVAAETLDVRTNNQSPTPRPVLKTKTKSHSISLNGQRTTYFTYSNIPVYDSESMLCWWTDTLLGGLPKPLETHVRLRSRPRTSGSKFNSSEQQSIMSEIPKYSASIGQLVRPTASEPRNRKFKFLPGPSFEWIFKNEKITRNQECFAELMSEPNGSSFASQNCTTCDKTEFIEFKALQMIPSKSTLADNDEGSALPT